MEVYPINLIINRRRCLVVGGGLVAERKVDSLLEAGGCVRVVAPEVTGRLARLAEEGRVEWRRGEAQEADLGDAFLVILATDDAALNARLAAAADAAGRLVNAVDQPESCNFIVPASVRRGALLFAISTGGASPALAKRVREELEAHFGPEYGRLADLLGRLRSTVDQSHRTQAERAQAWERAVHSGVLELLRTGRDTEAEALARHLIDTERGPAIQQ